MSFARTYCTYFDSFFLAQGLVMLRSLRKYEPRADIYVLALDDTCVEVLRDICGRGLRDESIRVLTLGTLHAVTPELAPLAAERSKWAFYATHKPALAAFVLGAAVEASIVTFIDADTWFFNDPEPMFEELGNAAIGLTPHRFHEQTAYLTRCGLYNAGCICWRVCETARECVADWQADCLSWCGEEAQPDGRFMNQGYLTRWPERYPGVRVIGHPGINLAPWNVETHILTSEPCGIRVDGQPLIFYHYSNLRRDEEGNWYSYRLLGSQFDFAQRHIYSPYLAAVEEQHAELLRTYQVAGTGSVRQLTIGDEWVLIGAKDPPRHLGPC